jgi:molybdopterin synthase catalytic subunit
MDRYGNAIYLTPMVLGAAASVFAAAWRFLAVRQIEAAHPSLDALCVLPGRIRKTDDEAELMAIEDEVDAILRTELLKSADRDESASETQALIAVAHRLDNLIHHRRTVLAVKAPPIGEAG